VRRAAILCLALGACGGGGGDNEVMAPQPQPVTPPAASFDLTAYLAPWACADGKLELVASCADARAIQPADPRRMELRDLPGSNSGPEGYQVGGGWALGNGRFVSIYSYSPWGPRTPPHDGGEVYAVEGDRARAVATQDGGKPYLQVFQGPECGGEGWALFWADAKEGAWTERVARLSIGQVGEACKPLGQALTRYRIEDVKVTVLVDGVPTDRTIRTVISQHFDHATVAQSEAMEEFYLGFHVGRYRWSSYTLGPPAGADLGMRCPARPFSGAPGFRLNDCRDNTNLRTADGTMSGDRYGWPPQGGY
jgi:hypothetical protein